MIKIKNLNFGYDDELILKNININIQKNSWVSIMGNNGSGKSTLAKLLVGLLQHKKGDIFIDNKIVNLENLLFLRKKIGIVFQNPDYQFVGITVKDDIAFGLENKNMPREKIIQKVFYYADKLGVSDLLDRNQQELSGGQKQKVAIASVLAIEPEIIIFDEITSFLEPKGKKDIENIIQNITDKTIITITHDLEFASKSDRIIFLYNGQIIKDEKPSKILSDQHFLNKYHIEKPLALRLFYALQNDKICNKVTDLEIFRKMEDFLWLYNLKK